MAGNGVSPFEMSIAYDQLVFAIIGTPESQPAFWFKETNVDVEGALENEWDKKKAGGQDGARATDKGYQLYEPKITWLLYNEEHYQTYLALLEAIRPQRGKKVKPVLFVSHPQIAESGVVKFNVAKIHPKKFIAVDQWEVGLELIEWVAAPKPTKKPTGSFSRSDLTNGQFILETKSQQYGRRPSQEILLPPPRR